MQSVFRRSWVVRYAEVEGEGSAIRYEEVLEDTDDARPVGRRIETV